MHKVTITFQSKKDFFTIEKIIEVLNMNVSIDKSSTIIPDSVHEEADENYKAILNGNRQTKPWSEVKSEIKGKK